MQGFLEGGGDINNDQDGWSGRRVYDQICWWFLQCRTQCRGKILRGRPRPLAWPTFFDRMLTRDLFAVDNFLAICSFTYRPTYRQIYAKEDANIMRWHSGDCNAGQCILAGKLRRSRRSLCTCLCMHLACVGRLRNWVSIVEFSCFSRLEGSRLVVQSYSIAVFVNSSRISYNERTDTWPDINVVIINIIVITFVVTVTVL